MTLRLLRTALATATVCLPLVLSTPLASAKNANWPNAPDQDPRLAYPDDPGYIECKDYPQCTQVTGGEWTMWSFIPDNIQKNKGFRQPEIAMGTGLHADRAWQRTIGDRRTIIAVLDSGIKWDEGDLQMKYYLNKGELTNCKPTQTTPPAADEWDIDGNGYFNIADYLVADPGYGKAKDDAGNKNGLFEPGDLIRTCSDGKDDDGNGYTDDISGWDAFQNDNDPYDDNRYGHGTGEARDSAAAGNDGKGTIGVCPECTVLMVRAGDSFLVDANDFATSVTFAVDSGALVIQEALGSINMTPYAQAAIEYAYNNNAIIIASAADELSFHHNMPGTANHTMYTHAIVFDGSDMKKATTFLNYHNCSNHGMQLVISTPGSGCSSEATGRSAGHAGLMYSAGFKAKLDPPLSSAEAHGVIIQSADDIDIPESQPGNPGNNGSKFESGPGWDFHFGYGRNNARKSVDLIMDGKIPPEADIVDPLWFEPVNVATRKTIDITGRVGARTDGKPSRYEASTYTWKLEYALGGAPKGSWSSIANGTGLQGGGIAPVKLTTWDLTTAAAAIDWKKPLKDPHQWAVTLKLTVTAKNAKGESLTSEFRKGFHFINDATLKPGFPKNLGASLETPSKMVDLDGDKKEEIIIVGSDGAVHAFKHDGTELAGFPARLDRRADTNPASKNQITKACAFRAEKDKAGCIAKIGTIDVDNTRQTVIGSPAVGALTGDKGDLSIVILTYDGYAFVFDKAGKPRAGWPQRTDPKHFAVTDTKKIIDEGFFAAPVLYDMDSDGKLEIVAAAMDNYVYIWRHDGTPLPGWPLLVTDQAEDKDQKNRIIDTPAVGDADGDKVPDIAVGTNEVYGDNESRGYLLKGTGATNKDDTNAALHKGWPVVTTGLIVNTLPVVGRGTPTNPAMFDIEHDGKLEIHLDALAFTPFVWRADGTQVLWKFQQGSETIEGPLENYVPGDLADSDDTPTYTLMNHAAIAKFDEDDTVDLLKGTAGLDFALTFAESGKKAEFDHQVSAWSLKSGTYVTGYPKKIEDWQFFINPVVIDITGDGLPETVQGSGGYLVHAWNYKGEEAAGFPKNTGGWLTASVGIGDMENDGKYDVIANTRSGWLFAWGTEGPTWGRIEWQSFGHDLHNTNNYESPVAAYNNYPKKPDNPNPEPAATDTGTGTTTDTATGTPDVVSGAEIVPGADAGIVDAGTITPTTAAPKEDSGCAVATPRTGASVGWAVLLMLAGLVMGLRSRLTRRGRA